MFLNPVLLLFFMFNHFVSFSLACALWMLFNAFLPPLMIILLVLVMELHHSKARTCLHVYGFDDDFSQVPKFALQLLVDHNHLASFCEQINPLSSLRTIDSLPSKDDLMGYACAAQDAVNRMNVIRLQQTFGSSKCKSCNSLSEPPKDFKGMPLVWDTGASQGLTPFIKDFIHYQQCDIPVKDVSKINRVIGIGTVMYKFCATNGDEIFLPGVAFHLPTADIRLLSPQSYHQRWGGFSLVGSKNILMNLWQPKGKARHVLEFPLHDQSNVPTLVNIACTDEEHKLYGPAMHPSLVQHYMAFDNSWRYPVDSFQHDFVTNVSTKFPSLTDE